MRSAKKKAPIDVQEAIDLGVEVIVEELAKLKVLAQDEDQPLDPEYTNQITKYVNTLVAVGKDQREQSAAMDLSELSDEELANLAKEAVGDEPS